MKCYKCKAIIPDRAAFCPKCGESQTISREMINDAAGGSQSALTALYNRTYSAVYNTIKFLVKDEDDVLDILQDSYIKAFDSLDQLQEADKFEPWVKRIAHNKAVDHLRKSRPVVFSGMVSDDSEEMLEFEDDRPENLPEVVIDRNETTRLINEILDSLPDDQRACISLFYYDQLSTKEIASELGIPEATVKSRLQYGRSKIKARVMELEKKGTKLYSLSPLAFLMLLFRQQAQSAQVPSSAVLESVLAGASGQTAAGAVTATSAGTATAKTAGTVTAKTAGTAAKSIAAHTAVHAAKTAVTTKIIAVVAAAAIIGGGGTAAVIHHTQQTRQEAEAAVSSLSEKPEEPEGRETLNLLPSSEEPSAVPEEPSVLPEPPHESEAESISEPIQEDLYTDEPEAEEKTEEVSIRPAETETPAPPAVSGSWSDAFQIVLDGYQTCMSEGPGGTSPYLRYSSVRYAQEASDGTRAIMYGLHDVSGDGVPELILALNEMYSDQIPWYTPFEIYAFDGTAAVPLFPDILEDNESLHIGANGVLWTDSGNSGFSPTTFYELPEGSAEVKETDFFDTVYGEGSNSYYYLHYADGVNIETIPRDSFRSGWLPEDAEIEYQSILRPVPSSWGSPASAGSSVNTIDIDYVRSQLGIPADIAAEAVIGSSSYWEAGDMWLVSIDFYHEGRLIASALVDQKTSEPARNILMYTG